MSGTMPTLRALRQPGTDLGWFESALGLGLIESTQRQVIPLLTSHIGVRGLYVRPSAAVSPLLSGNMLQSTISVFHQGTTLGGDLRAEPDSLPIESESLSLVYLLHTTDLPIDVPPFLAECARMLLPEGVLFLLAHSSTSLWRLRWRGCGLRARSEAALRRLLQEAGLDVEYALGLGPAWPRLLTSSREPASRWVPYPLRASVLLMARKRRPGMTPLISRKPAVALGSRAHAG